MNEITSQIWPYILTFIISNVSIYVGVIHTLRIKVAVLEQQVDTLQKNDDILVRKSDELLGEFQKFKDDASQKLGKVQNDVTKISTTLDMLVRNKKAK